MSAPTAAAAAPEAAKEPVLYVCAVCLHEQRLETNQPIMCANCAQEHGASKVFFKKRVKSTTYSTI